MNIKKILNNNVVLSTNDNNEEIVVMGRGLAFQKKVGQTVDAEKIEKTFVMENSSISDKLTELLRDTPAEIFEIAYKIISIAKEQLPYDLDDYLYIALTDHLNFAISRYKQGISIANALLWEIKKYYKKEFELALESLLIINREIEVDLPQDEAASIALHFVNSQLSGENVETTMQITKIVNSILTIVIYHYNIKLDEASINYERFLTHLKFFALRYIRSERNQAVAEDNFLFEQVKNKYPKAFHCSEKVAAFVSKTYGWKVSNDEKIYLTLHIHRVTSRADNH
ncbi:transcription antiterminator LicT [Paraliobacillus ryukyuensis]|uniref:BglG family transcriptional antiterminator n=1 Tax=Paraliobacillus ryukyuensis TaxID=200904 RepID=A0A366DX04_9BACI|nr:PRD domain-containing protein [Paraliobacillus ryukyuensis]RBO94592.1 BglG family transcriptional antiterminator [Paraliobacillus ryukyuensis]